MFLRALTRRLLLSAVTLLGVAIVVFVLVRVVPGNPVAMMIAPGASEADVAALRARSGLDEPIILQFGVWLSQALTGDFGASISLKQNVMTIVLGRLPATLELAALALAIAVFLGGAAALLSMRWRGSWIESLLDNFNGLVLAVPDFIWALLFVLLLGVWWPVLPVSGRADASRAIELSTQFYLIESLLRLRLATAWDVLRHMIMPALALALPLAGVIGRVLKNTLIEVMAQDYIVLARIKGMSESRILLREALRNAMVPVLTLTGVQFTFLIGGTVIAERIFAYPGIGNVAIDAVINRDLPLIQGLVLIFAVIFIVVNLSVDLLAAVFNPRLRHA